MAQDSGKPDFWETRYRDGAMPWDAGRVPRDLIAFVGTLAQGRRVLVPGCGSAYEAYFMAENALQVLAIDFSPAAVEEARKHLGCFSHIVQLADFFEFDYGEPYDVVYERAFLCALPPRLWRDYAERMAEIIRPGGLLAGFFFIADHPRGPPFGTSQADLNALLTPKFALSTDKAVEDSIPIFQGNERWQVWQRR